MNILRNPIALIAVAILLNACSGGPKTIPEEEGEMSGQRGTGIFSTGAGQGATNPVDPAAEKDLHSVVALETLPTTKYVYVRVKEGEKEYWLATLLQEVTIGRNYFYRGGY